MSPRADARGQRSRVADRWPRRFANPHPFRPPETILPPTFAEIAPTTLAIFAGAAALLAWLGTRAIIRHALRLGLIDLPNARSSHVKPRPRGGGIAIVAAFALAASVALPEGDTARTTVWPWVAGAILIAGVGLLDDLRGLGQSIRLLAQAIALGLALFAIGSAGAGLAAPFPALAPIQSIMPPIDLPVSASGAILAAVVLLAGVWWINLFNFMDGIDGIAACQAIFMLLAGIAVRGAPDPSDPAWASDAAIAVCAVILAAAVAGFLMLNWAPARIFMGDCGSLFLGFAIFTMAIHDVTRGHTTLWAWLILSGCFLVDASVTLIRRLLRGDDVRKAHRSHAYQQLARRHGSHATVTLVYCLVNVVWLLPLALAARNWPASGPVLALVAVVPLAGAAWRFGAGTPDR